MAETIGQQLKQAREARQLTTSQVMLATRIRPVFIEALEADDFEAFPSVPQGRGFLRIYAEYLGLSLDELVARQRADAVPPASAPDVEPPPAAVDTGGTAESFGTTPDDVKPSDQEPSNKKTRAELQDIKLGGKTAGTRSPDSGAGHKRGRKSSQGTQNRIGDGEPKPSPRKRKASETGPGQSKRSVRKPATEPTMHTALIEEPTPEAKTPSAPATIPIQPSNGEGSLIQAEDQIKARDEITPASIPVEVGDTVLEEINTGEPGGTESDPVSAVPPSSREIFLSIGMELRQRRELLGLTRTEIERHIHVRENFLEILETGDFESLPSSVQGRGMVNNYARFLDMDADALLLRFAEGLQAQRLERQPPVPTKAPRFRPRFTTPPFIRRILTGDLIVGGGLVILLILFAIWGTNRIIAIQTAPTPQSTSPSISDILLNSTPVVPRLATATQFESTDSFLSSENLTEFVTLPTEGKGRVHVIVIALERAFLRVSVDGKIKFEGRVVPGTAYPFDGNQQIEVLTGNAAALKIIYNETDLGVLGEYGEIVDHIYGISGVMTPTGTPPPTATATPRVTPTLTRTATPIQTPTPLP